MQKEARARIKINDLLKRTGWRFFDDENGRANITLEKNVKLTRHNIDDFGKDFEKTKNGFVDFLLLDENNFPFVVLEAKSEDKDPLDAKEQARNYAKSQNARFIILSNGNIHYLWDLEKGNPTIITSFPTYESLKNSAKIIKDSIKIAEEVVAPDYIVLSQYAKYKTDPCWLNEKLKESFIHDLDLKFLRPYQLDAIRALQEAARKEKDRFLFEMATGTGKTLVCAAIIKLLLRTGNVSRVLFLVDRIELEDQAYKNFKKWLSQDYICVKYKENRDDWMKAEIVVSTVQSLTVDYKYKRIFSPTDFDFIVSDEAHRSINGNARALFEYFIGYKLGLTATPKDYLKNIDEKQLSEMDPRKWERRQLLDTYNTFGCSSGVPTFRYSLVDGVKDGYLVNPIVADARTDITTELLSEKGYSMRFENEEGTEEEQTFFQKDFEKKFFSDKTNLMFCDTFIKNALLDPLSGEVGKSIIYCVSQKHASKITQVLNELAEKYWPGKYNSDFAVQVTSNVPNSQDFSIQFSDKNNNLNGTTKWLEGYKSSKARICVTVGMMTTGYDCQDLLNLCLMRPIFSPTEFIQIKGRGTRKFTFEYKDSDGEVVRGDKEKYKMFDFFANYEYFEEKYDYDQILKLPLKSSIAIDGGEIPKPVSGTYSFIPDPLRTLNEKPIGYSGMRIDREFFEKTSSIIKQDKDIKQAIENEQWDTAVDITRERYENKPEDYITLEKLGRALKLDRSLTWLELIEHIYGFIPYLKTKDDLLNDEFEKFVSIYKPEARYIQAIKNFIKAYITDKEIRDIIDRREYSRLADNPKLSIDDLKELENWKDKIPMYVMDYVSINKFA
jgi:type I restriction enzyme R subunit